MCFKNENRTVIGKSCKVFFWFFYNAFPDLFFVYNGVIRTGYLPPTDIRVREKVCNSLVLRTTIIEIFVVQNAKVLVQTIWFTDFIYKSRAE